MCKCGGERFRNLLDGFTVCEDCGRVDIEDNLVYPA